MYGLPEDFDAGIFVGRTVQLVSVSAFQIHLDFDEDIQIGIASDYSVQRSSGSGNTVSPPMVDQTLFSLIEKRVTAAAADDEGTLTLTFENGLKLKVFDPNEDDESYEIMIGDRSIIV